MGQKFRLDKTAFKATAAEAANNHVAEWRDKSPGERLEAAWFLINQVYGTSAKTKLDRTAFARKKR